MKYMLIIYLLITTLVSAQHDPSHPLEGPSDWPMFQYNAQHTGYNDKDNITLPLQLLWSKQFPIQTCKLEPITAVGDRIIVTNERSYNNPPDEPTIRCVNALTGEIEWFHEFLYYKVSHFDQASYYNSELFIMEGDNDLDSTRIAVYDLESGAVKWWYLYWSQFDDQLGSIIHKGKLIFPSGYYNGMQCIDIEADTTDWWVRAIQKQNWSPAAHDTVVYKWLGTALVAHNLWDGNEMWYIMPQVSDTIVPWPSKKITGLYDMFSAPVIDKLNDMLYLYWDGGIYGFNYITKRRIWKHDLDFTASYTENTPAVCNGVVYVILKDEIVAFNGADGEELLRYKLDMESHYSPIIANNLLFVSTENKTLAFDIDTYEIVWEYPAGGFLTVANNRLFIASHTGTVYAFGKVPTSVTDPISQLPSDYTLSQNYPNPFNPSTKIEFSIPKNEHVEINIYNVLGQLVRQLTNTLYPAGKYTLNWNGKDDDGNELPTGVYFYKLTTEDKTISKKMMLVK